MNILRDIGVLYGFLQEQNAKNNALFNELNSIKNAISTPLNFESNIKEDSIESLSLYFVRILSPFFKEFSNLKNTDELCLALIERVVSLKENSILNILKKLDFTEEKIDKAREILLNITEEFSMQNTRNLLDFVEKNNLLTPIFRVILRGCYEVGLGFNAFFKAWQKRLILGINRDLEKKYNGDMNAILKALEAAREISLNGEISSRSYSVAILKSSDAKAQFSIESNSIESTSQKAQKNSYRAVAYAEYFESEISNVCASLDKLIKTLQNTKESANSFARTLEQKSEHIAYFKALRAALSERDTRKLLPLWQEVDIAWMALNSPIQIGHPLEFYEDHYRCAVAPEWDLRIARIWRGIDLCDLDFIESINNIENFNLDSIEIKTDILFSVNKDEVSKFFESEFIKFNKTNNSEQILHSVRKSLSKSECYGGQPLAFFGAELNGLFSAQVVPNDEMVSKKYGKKIFYFPDRVLAQARAKPFLLLGRLAWEKNVRDFGRELLFLRQNDWYKVYDFSTNGHEFGHILWVGDDSESIMNKSGMFKNVEEYKATMGGLALYFWRFKLNFDSNIKTSFKDIESNSEILNKTPLLKEMLYSAASRAVGLIAWQREGEVLPYYCEGLIHLSVLFESGFLKLNLDSMKALNEYLNKLNNENYIEILEKLRNFDKALLSLDFNAVKSCVELYKKRYFELCELYLNKQDSIEFLSRFAVLKDGIFLPKDSEISSFVGLYYRLYQNFGQVADLETPKIWLENYKRDNISLFKKGA